MDPDRYTELYRRHHRGGLGVRGCAGVVLISQELGVQNPAVPRLRQQVWSAARLTEVATDPAFTD